MGKTRVVINADDFGLSPEVNAGVVEAFERGYISSATLMANMAGFAEACQAIRDHSLNGKIGVHLNIIEGQPLTEPIKSCPRLYRPEGMSSPRETLRMAPEEVEAIRTELRAQVEACLGQGITPSHFDSHSHTHCDWPVGTVVIELARRYGVPAVRLTRNCGEALGLPKRVYKLVYNTRLRLAGLAKTRYFGNADQVREALERHPATAEVMTHPTLTPDGSVTCHVERYHLESKLRYFREEMELVSYSDLAR